MRQVNRNPDARELRRFSIAMLVGLGVFGCIAAWRAGSVTTGAVWLWIAGVVLAVAGMIPGLARPAYLAVHFPSSWVGFVISRILLTILFYGMFLPIGLALRLVGHDPLRLRSRGRAGWYDTSSGTPESWYRQF